MQANNELRLQSQLLINDLRHMKVGDAWLDAVLFNNIQSKIDKLQKLIEDMPNEPLFVVEARLDGQENAKLIGILNTSAEAKKFVYKSMTLLDSHHAEQPEFITTEWVYEEKIGRYRSTEGDPYVMKDGLEEWKGF